MNTSDLKINLFRQIDSLDASSLKEFYGVFLNFINQKKEEEEWNLLSESEKNGIIEAIHSLDENKGILHQDVIHSFKSK